VSDDRMMDRVRGLLAQAEHPNTSKEEAEAFTAKAADLMAKYGIDSAMVADRGEVRESVTQKRIDLLAPYAREKADLLSAVARNSGCRLVRHTWGRTMTHVTAFGFPADLERVEVLYTSLVLQATRDVLREEVPYWENTAAYRRTWLVGFAGAVGARLRAAAERARDEAESQRMASGETGRSVELVLADRSTLVTSALEEAFPKLTPGRVRELSGSGTASGYAAGRRADLGGPKVTGGGRRRIGGAR
jgi:hypothetical protein